MAETSLALALSGLSFIMAVIWGDPLVRLLRHWKIGKLIRVEGPNRHFTKMGIPTMGGVMFVLPTLLVTGLLNAAALIGMEERIGRSVILPMSVMVLFAILGAVDDWEGIRGPRRGLGMKARTKLAFQLLFALAAAVTLYLNEMSFLYWPATQSRIDLGLWYLPVAVVLIVGMSNAVNFTDGLDGLAGMICVTAFAAYGAIALSTGLPFLGRFCFTLVGALFGYLWFNVHPAALIMGDTGSLALGATLGVVALMTGQWLLLPLIAAVPVAELMSVVIQVGYFKLTKGKRVFKMAPIHHHYELSGWSETKVVQRFWLVSLLFALLGMGVALW
jgi:phospho-N-acetylmuramoyl-pentapeptide-transferase